MAEADPSNPVPGDCPTPSLNSSTVVIRDPSFAGDPWSAPKTLYGAAPDSQREQTVGKESSDRPRRTMRGRGFTVVAAMGFGAAMRRTEATAGEGGKVQKGMRDDGGRFVAHLLKRSIGEKCRGKAARRFFQRKIFVTG